MPALSGCAAAIRPDCERIAGANPDLGAFRPVPAVRIGSIPFPGLFSLYADADPADLGEHVYRVGAAFEGVPETGRGVLYTCRAGFLDLAHVRNTIDNAAHIHARIRYALRNGRRCVRYRLFEPSVYLVEIDYPESWWALGPEHRRRLADETAIRAAESLALHSMTWHEILTWHGFKSAVVISEKPSAFTYEDATSHAVGARVAGRALRESGGADSSLFCAAVTRGLDETLRDLGAVDIGSTHDALDAVRGDWWSGTSVNRRHIAGGLAGDPIEPWLIPGFTPCGWAEPERFECAPLHRLSGGSAPSLRVLIDPRVLEGGKILGSLAAARGLETRPRAVDIESDFPLLLDRIRSQIREERGDAGLAP